MDPTVLANVSSLLTDSGRVVSQDKRFNLRSVESQSFQNFLFQRLVAKEVTFRRVQFNYTIFDTCYLRKCVFDNCDFTGCRFTSSNFYGSSFTGCKFDYAVFERTILDNDILDVGCPGPENLRLKFARSLRANFQALGDVDSVNKAIQVELAATVEHHWKSWHSKESYYRHKYKGFARCKQFFTWINFKLWDYVWGNGESLLKLGRAVAFVLLIISLIDVWFTGRNGISAADYGASLKHSPAIFFGIPTPAPYSPAYLSVVMLVRLVMIGFLLSIIIKRFSRR